MTENFDLWGHPIPEWKGQRGRPPYEPTEKDRNKIKLLLALGWSNRRIANAIGRSEATIKRYFRAELKERTSMRDRLEARRLEKAWELAESGNVGAMREFGRLLERNDRMEVERELGTPAKTKQETKPAASERIGKKQLDEIRARDADADLMAELEQEASQNARH